MRQDGSRHARLRAGHGNFRRLLDGCILHAAGGEEVQKSFHGMGQGIHTGICGHRGREADRKTRIENCRIRDQTEVIDGVFVWFPVDTVCDDSCRRCLRTGSGCRRHGKQRRKFPTDFQEAPHRRNRLFRTADAGTDQLCCIENGSAADGEDSLSLNLLIKTETLFHALNLRIRGDFGENGDGNVFFFTAIQQRRQCSAADKAGGSHQENPGDPRFRNNAGSSRTASGAARSVCFLCSVR